MNDDLGDVFRHLADNAPSDEGLLAGVHAASARAAVRRRVLLASAAVLAVLLGGIGVVSTNGSERTSQDGLVIDASDTPTPEPSVDSTPTVAPTAGGTSPSPSSATYRGRAVGPDGEPIAGLYVYDIPGIKNLWFRRDYVARTTADGTFDIPCPKGKVLLSPYAIGRPIPFDAPNWRVTYVGGGHLLGEARRPACTDERQDTTLPEGSVIHGLLGGDTYCPRTWAVLAFSETEPSGHIAVQQEWLRVVAVSDGPFRLAGLPPGHYTVVAREEAPEDPTPLRESTSRQITIESPGSYDAGILRIKPADCAGPSASPTPVPEPEPSATPEPTATPTPEPATSTSP